jgi:carboxypeptidase C (cathepsin A)
MMRVLAVTFVSLLALATVAFAQQPTSPGSQAETPSSAQPPGGRTPAARPQETARPEERRSEAQRADAGDKEEHFDMTEVPPVVSRHQVTVNGKLLKYVATAGRLPIKREDGKIEAEMFFVAYTLEGQDPATRPLTFAFNGGPGSASLWLHLGALGPRRVLLQPDGFMPAAPYRNTDNAHTPLDVSDLVLVDAIGTGFSRAATTELAKKFWGVKGDIEAFGEFVRLYITRYQRWTSPLFLLGESYGTTRAAGVAGYLADHGISFNGIILLSTVLSFETLQFTKTNDLPYQLVVPSYTMIAAYHKKLAPELMQDLAKTRKEVERWASTEYALALAKGDALTPAEREAVINQMARYTGLDRQFIDQANLRVNVQQFTHNLLLDRKLRVGRLDGRFTGPDPNGLLDTPFYDPAGSATTPPFTSVLNAYARAELRYATDMPYNVSAFRGGGGGFASWEWGSAREGFTDTATALRQAMTKNPYLKVLVMEGYYDLATPYFAANYTFDHLDLPAPYRKNISFATYDSGHMVYLHTESLAKFKRDVAAFVATATTPAP